MLLNVLLLAVGFVLLYYGAEWLVRGSASLAHRLGLAPVVIGLTIVAFGTSMPELTVSLIASYKQQSMISIGNVVGSNICNIALILGLAAAIQPLAGARSMVRRDVPLMVGVSVLLTLITANSVISRLEGAFLFAGIIAYTYLSYVLAARESKAQPGEMAGGPAPGGGEDLAAVGYVSSPIKQVMYIVLGLAAVVGGAEILIEAAIKVMRVFGVSEKFIGLTLVAVGTSLPELATSVVAAMRRQMDISIGNIVGSNIFNILCVLGASSLVRPIPVPGGFTGSGLAVDYAVMIGLAVLLLAMMWRKYTLTRANGFTLLACYTGYLGYLIVKG